jgi:hypothetical protein
MQDLHIPATLCNDRPHTRSWSKGKRFLSPLVGSLFAAIADKVLRVWQRLLTVSNACLKPPRSAQSLRTYAPNITVAPIVSEKLA